MSMAERVIADVTNSVLINVYVSRNVEFKVGVLTGSGAPGLGRAGRPFITLSVLTSLIPTLLCTGKEFT